jgi:DNA-directed RNA polymerase specialized sigma24 family protein
MGDTNGPIRQPQPAAECPAASTLRDTYYRPLVRLAALLTGDDLAAEAIACAALAVLGSRSRLGPEPSPDEALFLHQQVLIRGRRHHRARTAPVTRAARGATDFAELPVVRALQVLPPRGREAVVLTHYLDLSEQQAAVVAGVKLTVLRAQLSQAMHTLHDRFPAA